MDSYIRLKASFKGPYPGWRHVLGIRILIQTMFWRDSYVCLGLFKGNYRKS